MFSQAVILAGGEGTRLRPITYEIPKPLVPVQGQPILTWIANWLSDANIQEILVIIPPKWKQVFEAWRDQWNDSTKNTRVELWEEPEPMGTMGAMVHHLSTRFIDPIIITNGDELKALNLSRLMQHFQEQKRQNTQHALTVALREVSNPSDYGVAELEGDRIVGFEEKPTQPKTQFVNSGLYALDPLVLKKFQGQNQFLMFERELFPELAKQRRMTGCLLEGQWFDCGTLERWEKAIKEWKR